MGMGFAPTWLLQVTPPLLHKTTLTTAPSDCPRLRFSVYAFDFCARYKLFLW